MPRRLEERLEAWGITNWLLAPLGWSYALGWKVYEGLYELGLKTASEPHKPVVCVGNLVVGGTGKTPLCLHIAAVLRSLGHEVVLSMSGYGSPASASALAAPAGELGAAAWGDEPAMVRWLDPSLPLIVGRDRVRAAEIARLQFRGSVLLLDDGFQHLRLKSHVSIILEPTGGRNGLCLPAGPYREPRSGLERADLVIPGRFALSTTATHFVLPSKARLDRIERTRPDASVLCAIARPTRLVQAVEAAGARVAQVRLLDDHDPLSVGTLFDGLDPRLPVIVTAKDWVKLRERRDLSSRTIWIARHEVSVQPQDEFRTWIADAVRTAAPT